MKKILLILLFTLSSVVSAFDFLDGTNFDSGSLDIGGDCDVIHESAMWTNWDDNVNIYSNTALTRDWRTNPEVNYVGVSDCVIFRADHWTSIRYGLNPDGVTPTSPHNVFTAHEKINGLVNLLTLMKGANTGAKRVSMRNKPGFTFEDVMEDLDIRADVTYWNRTMERAIEANEFISMDLYLPTGGTLAEWEEYAAYAVAYAETFSMDTYILINWNFRGTTNYVGDTIWRGMLDWGLANADGIIVVGGEGETFAAGADYNLVIEAFEATIP